MPGSTTARPITKPEVNNEKGLHDSRHGSAVAASSAVAARPAAHGFYDHDAYVKNADRTAACSAADVRAQIRQRRLRVSDRAAIRRSATKAERGCQRLFVLDRPAARRKGWEGLLRYDHLDAEQRRHGAAALARDGSAASRTGSRIRGACRPSLLLDVDQANVRQLAALLPTNTKYAVHGLVNF